MSRAIGAGEGEAPIVIASANTNSNSNIKNIFNKYGLLCNSEGFYQHTTECWSDSLQMIMLYSDTIKDKTQPTLLFRNLEKEDIKLLVGDFINTKLKKAFSDVTNVKEYLALYEKNITAVTKFYEAIQKRFQRHYTAEIARLEKFTSPKIFYERKNLDIQCFDDLLEISKAFRSTNEKLSNKPGPQAAIMSKSTKNILTLNREEIGKSIPYKSTNTYQFTGQRSDIIFLLNIYELLFGLQLDFSSTDIKDYKFNEKSNALYLTIKNWTAVTLHAVCFYTCGGIDYYYNNEVGNIAFPWRKFLKHYNELIDNKVPARLYFGLHITATIPLKNGTYKEILNFNSYPYIQYNVKGKRTSITYINEIEEPIEYILPHITSVKNPIVTVAVGTLEYNINFREKNPDFSVENILEIESLQTSTIENSEFTKSSGRFMRSRLIAGNKDTTTTSTSASSGGKRRSMSKKRRMNLKKSVTKRNK